MGQLPNASNYIYVTLLFTVIALHLRQALDMIMINRAFSTFREVFRTLSNIQDGTF